MTKFYPNPNAPSSFCPEDAATLVWGSDNSTASVFSCGVHGPHLGFHHYYRGGNSYMYMAVTREFIRQIRAVVDDCELALDEFEAMKAEHSVRGGE